MLLNIKKACLTYVQRDKKKHAKIECSRNDFFKFREYLPKHLPEPYILYY